MSLKTRLALELIATAYRLQPNTETWLERLFGTARSALPPGVLLALETDLETAETRSAIVRGSGANESHVEFLSRGHREAPDWCVRATYGSGKTWISLRESTSDDYFARAPWLEELHRMGLRDMLAVVSRRDEPTQPACALFSLCEARPRSSRAERRLWDRVAVHLGAARRLQATATRPADAVLRPDGTCLHAEAIAAPDRASLRDLVRSWDRAHARLSENSLEPTVDFWARLAEGKWLLVDHFDTDGRRYVVARRNPMKDSLRRLTGRERNVSELAAQGHANDWIALELGLSPATVSEHLGNARLKLGVQSLRELVDVVGAAARVGGA